MEELKVHIQHVMLWEFKNNGNATEKAKKICSVYGQGVITDYQIQNWFSKFHSSNTSLRDEPWPGCLSDLNQDTLRESMQKYSTISTWPQHIPIHYLLSLKRNRKKRTWKSFKKTLCIGQQEKPCASPW